MKIDELIRYKQKPSLYAKGTHIMWTDPYISEQLQEVHLNEEIDMATRKKSSIERTVQWILKQAEYPVNPLNILELGCGPGLYTERFALLGHNVTGIDFSERSLQTARERAAGNKLFINYIQGNYVELPLDREEYDLIYLIYTDFCVLDPDEQNQLLALIHKSLKAGGLFLFDVNYPVRMKEKLGSRGWEANEKGFWSHKPYLALNDPIPYFEHKAILEQHFVITEDETRIYRFWTRFFDENDLTRLLAPHGFTSLEFDNDVLEEDGLWNGDNILFCRALKQDKASLRIL